MPRRTSANNQTNEPRRSLRRSSRLQTNNTEETAEGSTHSRDTSTAVAVAPSASQVASSDGNAATAETSSSRQLPPLGNPSTVHAAGQKRDSSDTVGPSPRKKVRSSSSTARVSLDAHATDNNEPREDASPSVKYSSTITPMCSVQTRSRTDEKEEDAAVNPSNANLLGDNDLESRSSNASSATSTIRQQQHHALPEGVVDIYSEHVANAGTCRQNYCPTKSLSQAFHFSYGYEFYQHFKDQEHDDSSSTSRTNFTDNDTLSLASGGTSRSQHVVSVVHKPVLGTSPHVGELVTVDRQPYLTEQTRAILMDWLVELSEEYKFVPQTLALAVALVDKSLACGAPSLSEEGSAHGFFTVKREMIQCVGCACMWIAAKIEELKAPYAVDFVYMSDHSYTKEQIADMELTVCTFLEFRLSQVTPIHFIPEFLRASCACGDPACGENPILTNLVYYLLELSVLPSELAYTQASLKAAAAVYVARVTLGIRSGGSFWSKTLEFYTGYELSDLEETALTIHRYHRAAEESMFRSCFDKFSKEKYHRVALKTVPLESELGF